MRIKHFAGYGSVEAKKIDKYTDADGYTILRVIVKGEHERGLCPYMEEDAVRWLVPRFDKSAKNLRPWDAEVYTIWHGMPKDTLGYLFKYKV